jgi:hypothetical protein
MRPRDVFAINPDRVITGLKGSHHIVNRVIANIDNFLRRRLETLG